ncbi:MAG: hypothetical protein ACFE0O_01340 [Opitutales bacterium]
MFAVVLTLALGSMLLTREFQAMTLKREIAVLEAEVSEASAENRLYLRQSAEFARGVKTLQDLEKFYSAPFTGYRLLETLSALKPEDLVFRSIDFSQVIVTERRRSTVNYKLVLAGDSRDLEIVFDLKTRLEGLSIFDDYTGSVSEDTFQRDEETGVFPFRIEMLLIPE